MSGRCSSSEVLHSRHWIASVVCRLIIALIALTLAVTVRASTDYETSFQGLSRQFVCSGFSSAQTGGDVNADSSGVGRWERHVLSDINEGILVSGDYVTVRSWQGQYWSANGRFLYANSLHYSTWETFRIWKVSGSITLKGAKISPGDSVGFQTFTGQWVSANYSQPFNRVTVDCWGLGPWETFKINFGYNRKAAKDYALMFASADRGPDDNYGYNPAFAAFESDCTNFVSQALFAGGWLPVWGTYNDPRAWFYDGPDQNKQSLSWIRASGLSFFMPYSLRAYAVPNITDLSEGDVVLVDWSKPDYSKPKPKGLGFGTKPGNDGEVDHAMIVTTPNSNDKNQVKLTYHTSNRKDHSFGEILNDSNGYGKVGNYSFWRLITDFVSPALPPVNYQAHVSNIGWMGSVSDGELAGSTGQSRQIEAIRVSSPGRNVYYQAHVAQLGWLPYYAADGGEAGTTGRGLAMQAIRVWANRGHVTYYVHVQSLGWMGPYRDGEVAGTTGQGLRMEAIRIHISD